MLLKRSIRIISFLNAMIKKYFIAAPTCIDNNGYCPYWAGIGECEANPNYMLVHCKLSCGVCPEGKDQTLIACMVVYPIVVGSFASLFNCKTVGRSSD